MWYYLFDLLAFDGTDLRPLPLRDRKRVLRAAFDFEDPLRFSAHRDADGEAYHRIGRREGDAASRRRGSSSGCATVRRALASRRWTNSRRGRWRTSPGCRSASTRPAPK